MTGLQLAAALAAVVTGVVLCARRKEPLFFKILLYACMCASVSALFTACYALVLGAAPTGFQVGCLGMTGFWFFLLSAYFGALDRLADGGERAYRPYRLAALAFPAALVLALGGSLARWGIGPVLPLLVQGVPMALTLYFAAKHLLLPDVEMGIIRVMRPYNGCVLLLCLCQVLGQMPGLPPQVSVTAQGAGCCLLVLLLPAAERGVRQWFM